MKNIFLSLALLLTVQAQATSIFDDVIIENTLQMQSETPSRAAIIDGSSNLKSSSVSSTELGYLSGVTSGVQSQIDSKQANITAGTSAQYYRGDKTMQDLTASAVAYTPTTSGDWSWTSVPTTVLGALDSIANWIKNAASNLMFLVDPNTYYVSKSKGSDSNNCGYFSPCLTIQKGLDTADDTSAYYRQTIVKVAPGSGSSGYVENVTISQQGINLECEADGQQTRACYLTGTLTVNVSGTSGGGNYQSDQNEVYVSGFVISTSGANNGITFSGTSFQRLILKNTYVDVGGTGSAIVASNSGVNGAGTKSTMTIWDSTFQNSNATNPTLSITNSRVWFYGSNNVIQNGAANDAVVQSGASTSFICNFCTVTGQVVVSNNTASATIANTTIASGTQSCIDTPSSASTGSITIANIGCTSTNASSVTGTGVLVIAGTNSCLSSSCAYASTVTKVSLNTLPQGQLRPSHLLAGSAPASATNAVVVVDNGHQKFTQTTAPTATVNANAGTGGTCALSGTPTDHVGTITITVGTGTPATGEQCRINFNRTWALAPKCTFVPANVNAAANAVQVYRGTVSTSVYGINFNVASAISTAYVYDYHCFE